MKGWNQTYVNELSGRFGGISWANDSCLSLDNWVVNVDCRLPLQNVKSIKLNIYFPSLIK
jgi:hypothetical protein